jgi:hypothetical protein
MAGERELIWGANATDAQWRTADDSGSGNFVVAEDMDGGTVLLEYDTTAGEWVSRGPVNLSGNDVTNVGALDAASISTDALALKNHSDVDGIETGSVTIETGTPPADDSWSSRTTTVKTIQFNINFDSPPQVAIAPDSDLGSDFEVVALSIYEVQSVSTNSFDIVQRQYGSDDLEGLSGGVRWIAVSQP